MGIRYQIRLVESERGWGQDYWTETFDYRWQAEARIREVNAKNTALRAPDYYVSAFPDIKIIEE